MNTIESTVKCLIFRRRPFVLVFDFGHRHLIGCKMLNFQAQAFFFWSAGMVVARWKIAGSGCGPTSLKGCQPLF